MTTERINPAGLARPSGFSHAVSATAGRMVFLAGQIGMDRDGKLAEGGVVPQFEQAFGNLLTALAAAGGQPSNLVSLTIYLTDVADYQAHGKEIGAVWRGWRERSTRPWRGWAWPGCGCPRRWSRSRASPWLAADGGLHVGPGGLLEQGPQGEEQVGGPDADPPLGQQFGGQAGVQVGKPPPVGQRPHVAANASCSPGGLASKARSAGSCARMNAS